MDYFKFGALVGQCVWDPVQNNYSVCVDGNECQPEQQCDSDIFLLNGSLWHRAKDIPHSDTHTHTTCEQLDNHQTCLLT